MNPVFLLMGLYFFANLYSFFLAVNGGGIRVDQLLLTFNENDAVSAFILIAFSLFFLFFIYKLNSACPVVSSCTLSSRWGWGVLIFQLLYVINSQYYGVNIAGVEDGVRASPYKFIFTLIDPDTLFLVVAIFLRSSKLFWINTLVYLCCFIRGWGGGFVLVPVLLLCRYYPVKLKLKYCIALFFIFSLLFLASPFLIEIKWLIRSGSDTALFGSNVLARGYGVSLLDTTEYIVNRFQMFGYVALLVEQSSSVTKAYSEG
ncbi:MAG: oligosaccharide repeat unit polymerase, partial [Chitinophagales bacterium]|nr:oligosaccharide repeat unit polymerase [Chitinophagales bacterium]